MYLNLSMVGATRPDSAETKTENSDT